MEWTEGQARLLAVAQTIVGFAVFFGAIAFMVVGWGSEGPLGNPIVLVLGALLGGALLTWILQVALALALAVAVGVGASIARVFQAPAGRHEHPAPDRHRTQDGGQRSGTPKGGGLRSDGSHSGPVRLPAPSQSPVAGSELATSEPAEEAELARTQAELARLEAELAQRELELATLRAELLTFEARYVRTVGIHLAEIDALHAQAAEASAASRPHDHQAREEAREARRRAEETAQTVADEASSGRPEAFSPSAELKKLFRNAAKRLHPDLATDESDREHRQSLMAEVNAAYRDGDQARLDELIARSGPDSGAAAAGDATSQLALLTNQIQAVDDRLRRIAHETDSLRGSELFLLKAQVDAAEAQGRDLLGEMRDRAMSELAAARERMETARTGPRA